MKMNIKTLQALVVDRHLGELSPEAVELLEFYLAEHEEARIEAQRVVNSLGVMEKAVLPVIPALEEKVEVEVEVVDFKVKAATRRIGMMWLARAAGVALLAGSAGIWYGRSLPKEATGEPVMMAASQPAKSSPWARYRLELNPQAGGMQVVRVGNNYNHGEGAR